MKIIYQMNKLSNLIWILKIFVTLIMNMQNIFGIKTLAYFVLFSVNRRWITSIWKATFKIKIYHTLYSVKIVLNISSKIMIKIMMLNTFFESTWNIQKNWRSQIINYLFFLRRWKWIKKNDKHEKLFSDLNDLWPYLMFSLKTYSLCHKSQASYKTSTNVEEGL